MATGIVSSWGFRSDQGNSFARLLRPNLSDGVPHLRTRRVPVLERSPASLTDSVDIRE